MHSISAEGNTIHLNKFKENIFLVPKTIIIENLQTLNKTITKKGKNQNINVIF